jgi:hypothetical protein
MLGWLDADNNIKIFVQGLYHLAVDVKNAPWKSLLGQLFYRFQLIFLAFYCLFTITV